MTTCLHLLNSESIRSVSLIHCGGVVLTHLHLKDNTSLMKGDTSELSMIHTSLMSLISILTSLEH